MEEAEGQNYVINRLKQVILMDCGMIKYRSLDTAGDKDKPKESDKRMFKELIYQDSSQLILKQGSDFQEI